MAVPLTRVQCHLRDQIGQAAVNAIVRIRLTVTEVDPDHGVIVPETISLQTDATGFFETDLWPNARGERESQYRVWVLPDQTCRSPIWDVVITVPLAGPVQLRDLIDTPPEPITRFLQSIETDSSLSGGGLTSDPLLATYAFTVTAGEDLGGHRAVRIADGLAHYADNQNVSTIGEVAGITRHAAVQGAEVLVQFAGPVLEPSWSWSSGPVYLGTNGLLVQSRPATGAVLHIAQAVTPTRILIDKRASIKV